MRTILLVLIASVMLISEAIGDEFARPISIIGYYPPYYYYYTEVYGDDHNDVCDDFLRADYYFGTYAGNLPVPCDELIPSYMPNSGTQRSEGRAKKREVAPDVPASTNQVKRPAARAAASARLPDGLPFPGRPRREKTGFKYELPAGTDCIARTPSQWQPDILLPAHDFIRFNYQRRTVYAKVFQVKGRGHNNAPINYFLAIETKPHRNPQGEIADIQETKLRFEEQCYALSGRYRPQLEQQPDYGRMLVLLCNPAPNANAGR